MTKLISVIAFLFLSIQVLFSQDIHLTELESLTDNESSLSAYSKELPKYFPENTDKAYYFIQKYIQLARRNNSPEHIARSFFILGEYYYYSFNYTEAKKAYKLAHKKYQELENMEMMGEMEMNIGLCHLNLDEYAEALQIYQLALEKYTEQEHVSKKADILQNIGIIYAQIDKIALALDYYQQALELNEQIGSQDYIAALYHNIGSAYSEWNEYEIAIEHYTKSLTVYKELGNENGTASTYSNIGLLYENQQKYQDALRYYEKAWLLFEKNENWPSTAILLYNLGSVSVNLNRREVALGYFQNSLEISKKHNLKLNIADNYLSISGLYESSRNFENALNYFRLYSEMKDSIFSEESLSRIEELEAKYQSSLKEKQIDQLEQENTEKDIALERRNLFLILIISFAAVVIAVSILSLRLFMKQRILNVKLSDEVEKHKNTSKQLIEVKENLEELIEERTHEIMATNERLNKEIEQHKFTTNQLVKAKTKAEESDKLKTNFLANVSHEIRTPMNAIVGFSQMLALDEIKHEQRNEYSRLVIDGCSDLTQLIDNIIDFSDLEVGNIDFKLSSVDPNDIINPLFKKYTKIVNSEKQDKVNMILKPSDETDQIMVDKFRISQILDHLLSNAVKFTEKGEIELGYYFEKQEVVFFVRDTGIGIKPESRELIFDYFRQLDEGTTRRYGGTGIGLAISKKIVDLMNGKLRVESEEGLGSIFYLTIRTTKFSQELPEAKNLDWSNKKIVIAEDKAINYEIIREMLKNTGITMLWAKDGLETIQYIKENDDIDLILLDIQMPKMDGYEVLKEIQTAKYKIPIIAQTAYALPEDKYNIIASGCDEYISKPISYNKLTEVLAKYLSANLT